MNAIASNSQIGAMKSKDFKVALSNARRAHKIVLENSGPEDPLTEIFEKLVRWLEIKVGG